jgi:hypothetical protein
MCYKHGKGPTHSTKAALEAEVIVVAYTTVIDPQSQDFMQTIEEDVKVIRAYHEDQEVDRKATPFVPIWVQVLQGTQKISEIVELYWHTKVFVAQEMLAKEPKFQKLRLRMEALERQNKLLLTMVSWLVKKQGGNFQVIQDCPASTSLTPPLVSLGDSFLQTGPPMPPT